MRVLNPRQINWGTEIDRRLANLREQSIGNPYFRLASFQLGLIVILLLLCWVWWDKMRQIKWVAAECLTDALNARMLAESRAVDAIDRHNRHIESCNRVIEGQAVDPEVYAALLRSYDEGVAEFLDLERVKPNTLGNSRMLLLL